MNQNVSVFILMNIGGVSIEYFRYVREIEIKTTWEIRTDALSYSGMNCD